eukprot:1195347-Prorocentrum_minimum.AAC.3
MHASNIMKERGDLFKRLEHSNTTDLHSWFQGGFILCRSGRILQMCELGQLRQLRGNGPRQTVRIKQSIRYRPVAHR